MPQKKPVYNFLFEIEGQPNATEQDIKDLLMRHHIRAANTADIFDGVTITHYKGVALYPEHKGNS